MKITGIQFKTATFRKYLGKISSRYTHRDPSPQMRVIRLFDFRWKEPKSTPKYFLLIQYWVMQEFAQNKDRISKAVCIKIIFSRKGYTNIPMSSCRVLRQSEVPFLTVWTGSSSLMKYSSNTHSIPLTVLGAKDTKIKLVLAIANEQFLFLRTTICVLEVKLKDFYMPCNIIVECSDWGKFDTVNGKIILFYLLVIGHRLYKLHINLRWLINSKWFLIES